MTGRAQFGNGTIILLNGAPRSGKSSIAAAIQEAFDGVWMNLGVDAFIRMTPARYQPGIGLRPGGERPDLEPIVVALYRALYDSIAAHSRNGIHVVADVGHHDAYSMPRCILPDCARRLEGLPALLVGVRCPVEVVMERRRETGMSTGREGAYIEASPAARWERAVHTSGIYDLEVDTSMLSPAECASAIREHLAHGPKPTALRQLAALSRPERASI